MIQPHALRAFAKLASYTLPPWLRWVAASICIVLILSALRSAWHGEYGFTDMLRYGSVFEPYAIREVKLVHRRIFEGVGYDGQFYATLSIDPTLRREDMIKTMDRPQYRGRRIFLPWCAYAAGRGNPAQTLGAYAIVNYAFWIGLVLLVFLRIRPGRIQEYACALAIIFSAGVTGSVMYALTDLPSAVLLFTALTIPVMWPLFLSAGILTRETTLMYAPVFFILEKLKGASVFSGVVKTAAALTAPILWYVYCMKRIPESMVMEQIFGVPFLAMFHRLASIVHHLPQTLYPAQILFFPVAISITAQIFYFFAHRKPADPLWLTGAFTAVFIALMGYGPWLDCSWILRYALPLTFAFNFLLARQTPRVFVAWFFIGNIGCMISPLSFPW